MELLTLLRELNVAPQPVPLDQPPEPGGAKKPKLADKDTEMTPVPVTYGKVAANILMKQSKGTERWTEDQQQEAKQYYGCHPDLLEGIEVFMNTERNACFMPSKSGVIDKAKLVPVNNNTPHLNVVVGNKYKIRAVWDTGCTNTIMSHGMYEQLKCETVQLKPTSNTFRGVSPGNQQYEGILEKLHLRFSDKLTAEINVAVVPNDEPFLLLGNDCIGGTYAVLTVIGSSDAHTYLVLQDSQGIQDIVQFVRNRERNEIPVAQKLVTPTCLPPEAPNEVEQLFLA